MLCLFHATRPCFLHPHLPWRYDEPLTSGSIAFWNDPSSETFGCLLPFGGSENNPDRRARAHPKPSPACRELLRTSCDYVKRFRFFPFAACSFDSPEVNTLTVSLTRKPDVCACVCVCVCLSLTGHRRDGKRAGSLKGQTRFPHRRAPLHGRDLMCTIWWGNNTRKTRFTRRSPWRIKEESPCTTVAPKTKRDPREKCWKQAAWTSTASCDFCCR